MNMACLSRPTPSSANKPSTRIVSLSSSSRDDLDSLLRRIEYQMLTACTCNRNEILAVSHHAIGCLYRVLGDARHEISMLMEEELPQECGGPST